MKINYMSAGDQGPILIDFDFSGLSAIPIFVGRLIEANELISMHIDFRIFNSREYNKINNRPRHNGKCN
ncbi:MAG: hypothetical protein ABSG89_03130 [Bacteroidales bacterium]